MSPAVPLKAIPLAVKDRVSTAEWQTRQDLAALYRAIAKFRFTDFIYTHISARVPGAEEHFLINPYGLLFEEVTASSLLKVDLDGKLIMESDYPFNYAGYVIHSAVHAARPDVACVIHTHSRAGVAVSAQEEGLLPISQHALKFWNRVAYHSYEGVALDVDERSRLQAALGDKPVMVLRNHGLLVAGRTIPEAFDLIYVLERACDAQIAAQSGGARLRVPPPEVCEKVARQLERPDRVALKLGWPAVIRMIDRDDPSWRN